MGKKEIDKFIKDNRKRADEINKRFDKALRKLQCSLL